MLKSKTRFYYIFQKTETDIFDIMLQVNWHVVFLDKNTKYRICYKQHAFVYSIHIYDI
jgi:hypothetical protein